MSDFDTSAVGTQTDTSVSTTANITVGANSNRVLVAKVTWRQTVTPTVSGAGATWTAAGAVLVNGSRQQMWYGVGPTTGAQTVTVTWSDTFGQDPTVVVESYYNVDQTTPVADYTTATGTSTAPTVTVPNVVTGDIVVDSLVHGSGGTTTVGANQTQTQAGDRAVISYAASYQAGADGGVMSWTEQFSDNWAISAMRLVTASGSSVTKTPAQAVLNVNALAPLTNAYTYVAIQDTLINESGQPIANGANIRLMVWFSGQAIGAPDYSVNGQTTNAAGSISWSVTPGGLANGQAIFYLAQDSISYSNYTCGRVVPTYG